MRKSMWKRTTVALTAAMLGAFAMPVMAAEESTEGTREVTDAAGNVVEVPENISKCREMITLLKRLWSWQGRIM